MLDSTLWALPIQPLIGPLLADPGTFSARWLISISPLGMTVHPHILCTEYFWVQQTWYILCRMSKRHVNAKRVNRLLLLSFCFSFFFLLTPPSPSIFILYILYLAYLSYTSTWHLLPHTATYWYLFASFSCTFAFGWTFGCHLLAHLFEIYLLGISLLRIYCHISYLCILIMMNTGPRLGGWNTVPADWSGVRDLFGQLGSFKVGPGRDGSGGLAFRLLSCVAMFLL